MEGRWISGPEELVADPPVAIGDLILVPLAKVSYTKRISGRSAIFIASKAPEAIVIVAPWGKKAILISGEEVPLEEIQKEVPGLEEMLEGIVLSQDGTQV